MEQVRILFVDDDDNYRQTFTQILRDEGYIVDAASSGLEAIEYFTLNVYDLVISDLMMDEINGIKFLQYIKKVNKDVLTMIITAEPSIDTEIASLDIYIDKYLVKGEHFNVLLKHIEHLLIQLETGMKKRNYKLRYAPEDLILDLQERIVMKQDKVIKITTREFDVLRVLMENPGKALSREDIIANIWDETHESTDIRVIDVHIRSLRKKLKTQAILSVRGYGYKWDN